MKPRLSIIIPCFNCENTLCEAVDSCYEQGMSVAEFEIIMVDDSSTDGTRTLMEEMAKKHENINLVFHPENRGGGATRNTGIKEATGEIIYCLDSDNFFEPHSVKPMLSYLKETKVDGVAFYERRFFVGTNKKSYSLHSNRIIERSIKLFDLLNDSGTLLDNFFYTKESYLKTEGYPEHHGFDTQCFEVRFLSAGNTVKIYPNSIFWHRQAGGHKSYFERVYESGEYSLNMYYIYEDIMYLLSEDVRKIILDFDVFGETKLGTKNLQATVLEQYKDSKANLFSKDYLNYLKPQGLEAYHTDHTEHDILIHALWLYRQQDYPEAGRAFISLLKKYPNSLILQFNTLRCSVGASIKKHTLIEKETLKLSQKFNLKKQKIDLNPNLLKKLAYKFKTLLS